MANTLYILEAANLFAGDHDPANSKHLSIKELKLPDLTMVRVDHQPGGGRFGIDVAVAVEKLEPTFKLEGVDPDLLIEFGAGSPIRRPYTAYGVVRDKRSGRAVELKAVMEGRLASLTYDTFTRGESMGVEYGIAEMCHYEVHFDGQEKLYWDFWTNVLRLNGQEVDPDFNRILRIPS